MVFLARFSFTEEPYIRNKMRSRKSPVTPINHHSQNSLYCHSQIMQQSLSLIVLYSEERKLRPFRPLVFILWRV